MPGSNRLLSVPRPPAAILVCHQVFLYSLSIAQLAVGAVYQNDCPKQPYIPIYLLVAGTCSLLLGLLTILACTAGLGRYRQAWSLLASLFFFSWFIAGNVWIYSVYEPNYNMTTASVGTYCDKTLYLFAFWTTNMTYILLGLLILWMCCSPFRCVGE